MAKKEIELLSVHATPYNRNVVAVYFRIGDEIVPLLHDCTFISIPTAIQQFIQKQRGLSIDNSCTLIKDELCFISRKVKK